jgi:hypothetical protein
MAVLRNSSKCSHTTCMLRFFTVSRPRFSGFRKAQLAIPEPYLIFEIDSNLFVLLTFTKNIPFCFGAKWRI